jgi:hypothetical protein
LGINLAYTISTAPIQIRFQINADRSFISNLLLSIVHSGDNRTGAGEGDDEQIQVDLKDSKKHGAQFLILVVNVFNQNVTFDQVSEAYCRILDGSNEAEICRFNLKACGDRNAVVMAKVHFDDNQWKIKALGDPSEGNTAEAMVRAGHIAKYITPILPKPREIVLTLLKGHQLPAMVCGNFYCADFDGWM